MTRVASRALACLLATLALGSCGPRTDRVVCEHCYCEPWGSRDASHPLSCSTLGRDIVCCVADSS
ncbi:MAG: hypothetical protein U0234_11445 [Sandaracinus sp.]